MTQIGREVELEESAEVFLQHLRPGEQLGESAVFWDPEERRYVQYARIIKPKAAKIVMETQKPRYARA